MAGLYYVHQNYTTISKGEVVFANNTDNKSEIHYTHVLTLQNNNLESQLHTHAHTHTH